MITLLIRGVTLPGAGQGVLFFIEPQWEELLNPEVSEQMKSTYLVTSTVPKDM
jgi:SNF family Na+-dependent transporter